MLISNEDSLKRGDMMNLRGVASLAALLVFVAASAYREALRKR